MIDKAIDRATAETSQKNIINGELGDLQHHARWIYFRWKGTVLRLTWPPIVLNTFFAAVIVAAIRIGTGPLNPGATWPLFTTPSEDHPLVKRMAPLYLIWTHHSTLMTFILTFFLSESFGCVGSQATNSTLLRMKTHHSSPFGRCGALCTATGGAHSARGGRSSVPSSA